MDSALLVMSIALEAAASRVREATVSAALAVRLDSVPTTVSVPVVSIVENSTTVSRKVVSTLRLHFLVKKVSLHAGDNLIGNDGDRDDGRSTKLVFLDDIDRRPSASSGFVSEGFGGGELVDILGFGDDNIVNAIRSKSDFKMVKRNTIENTVENNARKNSVESIISKLISKALVAMSGDTL